ncbi:LacI family DNA-binding transcriptional regulator [Streptomyces sp. NPDC048442]|uniref:LacI family DNA-binding transcriptional regulator n=1 Tax=Streptomyces sp. NPDC048442 TaxID=3154823 RepID=UPI00343708B2
MEPSRNARAGPRDPGAPPPPRIPTLKEVAREAGVSTSAVSFALNNRPGVSAATRRRVIEVAERLGRGTGPGGRSTTAERSRAIGMVLARPAGSLGVEAFFLQVVSGIQAGLAPHGHALVFQMVDDIDAECDLYRRWWAEGRVDGVIVVDPRVSDPRPDVLSVLGLPAVVVGAMDTPGAARPGSARSAPMPVLGSGRRARLSNIWADDAGAMDLIIHHLYELGHRRIAHMAGPPGLAHTARRIAALRSTARRLGLDHTVSVTTDFTDRQGAKAARRLLSGAMQPTALICHNEVMAVAAAGVATERGLRIPQDVSVVSWEDSAICRTFHPRITSLSREPGAFGLRAATEVLSLLGGSEPRFLQDPLPRLEARESTAEPPARSPQPPAVPPPRTAP